MSYDVMTGSALSMAAMAAKHALTHVASPAASGEMKKISQYKNKNAPNGARHGGRSKRSRYSEKDHQSDEDKAGGDSHEGAVREREGVRGGENLGRGAAVRRRGGVEGRGKESRSQEVNIERAV